MKPIYKIKCVNCGRVENVRVGDLYSWQCYCGCTDWTFADNPTELHDQPS